MKNIFPFLFFILAYTTAFGQGWERFYGDEFIADYGTSIVNSPDGGFVITVRNNFEATAKKISINGDEEWTNNLFSANTPYILNRANGGYFLTGVDNANGDEVSKGIDENGNTLWEHPAVGGQSTDWVALPDGFVAMTMISGPSQVSRWKVDLDGNLLWQDVIDIPGLFPFGAITATSEGGFAIGGFTTDNNALVAKFDGDGNLTWIASDDNPTENEQGNAYLIETSDGSLILALDSSGPDNLTSLNKFSATGDLLWETFLIPPAGESLGNRLVEDHEGNLLTWGSFFGPLDKNFILKLSNTGDFIFLKTFGGSAFSKVVVTPEGNYCAVGNSAINFNSGDAYLVLMNSDGQVYPNLSQGQIALDDNNDCLITNGETPLEGWVVAAEKDFPRYAFTDANGHYSIELDTGEYTLSIFPPNDLWAPCENPIDLSISTGDTLTNDFPVQVEIECPAMQVDISRPFLRRCFENTFTVQYCNYGTVPAEDATIDVTLDSLIEYVSSTLPSTAQTGNVFTFDLGGVDAMECGSFTITALVSCDAMLGQSLCFEAHAYPDSICGTPFNFSGASMVARAKCDGDSTVILELENVGPVPTSEALDYIVIEDEIIFLQGGQIFEAGLPVTFPQEANGSTWRIMCEQEPNHPGFSFPTAFVEGCGENGAGTFSIGFVNEHPMADGDGFVDMDCEEVVGAFDPNDKSALPIGYGPEHFIEPNTDIEYRIRFQNTGTDTAFNVVIRDTLSQFLNPASLRPGAASHNYDFNLTGNGIAVFTFPNIMLPDSNVNEALSHGFVTFKISQMPDLEPETVFTNSAAIYFDFNEPIITNETFHTIERDFIISASIAPSQVDAADIKVYPNPFSNQATFEVEKWKGHALTLNLFDSMGRLVRRENFEGEKLVFNRGELRDGIWFFQIVSEGQSVGSGKLVVSR